MAFFFIHYEVLSSFSYQRNYPSVFETDLNELFEANPSALVLSLPPRSCLILFSNTTCLLLVQWSPSWKSYITAFFLFHGLPSPYLMEALAQNPRMLFQRGLVSVTAHEQELTLPRLGKPEHPVFLACPGPASSGNKTLGLVWEICFARCGHKAFSFNYSINPKGNQPWVFTGRTDAEAEAPVLWPPDAKS